MKAKLSAYIDAANLFHGGNSIGIRIDYEKFKPIILGDRVPIDLNFYDCTRNLPQEIKFFSRISGFGYNLKLIRIHVYNGSTPEEKKIDTSIVADSIMDALVYKKIDTAVFCTGDKDILPAIEYLLKAGVNVEIASFNHCFAWELKRSGAKIIDLTAIAPIIQRRSK
jgi:uncharacterized LabA/DUF88 family protein